RYGTQDAMDRGTALHRTFALAVAAYAGLCDPPTVKPEYAGYHRSMQTWIDVAKPEPIAIEDKRLSPLKGLPFAGTSDLLCRMRDKGKGVVVVVDLKSGQKEAWHRIQVQAYGKLCPEAERLALLYIHEDGSMPTWEVVKPTPRNWALFHNALSVLIGRETL
ncbi:MAG TPA: hypothetical protein VK598_05995, partial [Nitrospiraceae bacterium]|nr:hypothetical protein [Nitrospiraceae bacterium]